MGFYKNTNGVLTPIAGGVSNSNAPIGAIYPYGGSSAPSGYLMCDGSAVSRSDYSALFNVIGTSFGAGDGSTTFNVPDLRGKFLEGTPSSGTIGTSIAAGLLIEGLLDLKLKVEHLPILQTPVSQAQLRQTLRTEQLLILMLPNPTQSTAIQQPFSRLPCA